MNTNPRITYLTRRLSRAWKPIRAAVRARGFESWFDLLVKESKSNDSSISSALRVEFKEDFQRIKEIQYDLNKELNEQSRTHKV